MPLEEYMDAKEAAKELGVSESRIRQMLGDGEIEGAIKIPPMHRGVWFIPRDEIKRLKKVREEQRKQRRKGRPPKQSDH